MIIRVERPKDTVDVTIMRNKKDNTWSYVNLTKQHICPCKFNSIEEALQDMNEQIKEGRVIKYYQIQE